MRYLIEEFRPVSLHVSQTGPFQDGPVTVHFVDANEGKEPATFFLLLSKNGRGKTTMLRAIEALVNLLGPSPEECIPNWLGDYDEALLQLDVRVKWVEGSEKRTCLVSLIIGHRKDPLLYDWGSDQRLLRRRELGVDTWHRLGVYQRPSGEWEMFGETDPMIRSLRAHVRTSFGRSLGDFEAPTLTAPTLMFVTSYRNIVRAAGQERTIARPSDWGYQLTRRIDLDGQEWSASLDNLLVWYYWLHGDDPEKDFQRVCHVINERVFVDGSKKLSGIQKDPPQAEVWVGPHRHRLDQLSSGEKSLSQLFVRVGSAMSRNSILLIDEVDLHLHPNWERRIVISLRKLARAHPGMTIIMSSHAMEVLERFDPKRPEDGVVKGGYIIEEGFPGSRSQP